MISAPLKDPITSYAQNFEDVLLWRALHGVGHGFYVDIGAQDPNFHSVSRGFYEKGWRGIHVEPTTKYAELLRAARPDEQVVQAAVLNRSGITEFYEIAETGMSTVREDIAENANREGWSAQKVIIPAITLDEIFGAIRAPEIHWLKIDVEGAELAVIEGWRTSARRPWIVLVEAIRPLSRDLDYEDWEVLLLEKGYTFVHFDSVNRYYVSKEHQGLARSFLTGPSMWDDFQVPNGSSLSRSLEQRHHAELNALHTEIGRIHGVASNAQLALESASDSVTHLTAQLDENTSKIELLDEQLHQAQCEGIAVRAELSSVSNALLVAQAEARAAARKLEQAELELDKARRRHQTALYEIDKLIRSFWWRCFSLLDRDITSSFMKFLATLDPSHEMPGRLVLTHAELVALPEDRFVEQAFLILLRREVDDAGRAHFLSRLQNGFHRDELLFEIRSSEEGRQLDPCLFGLTDGLRKGKRLKARRLRRKLLLGGWAKGRGTSVSDHRDATARLLASHDEAFVRQAYRLLLAREPDPVGLTTYVERIRNGDAKLAILVSIRRSREGREAKLLLPALDRRLYWYRLRHFPVLGRLFRFCDAIYLLPQTRRRLRAALNQAEIIDSERSDVRSPPAQVKRAEPTGTRAPVIAIDAGEAEEKAVLLRSITSALLANEAIPNFRWEIPPACPCNSSLTLMREELAERLLVHTSGSDTSSLECSSLSLLFDAGGVPDVSSGAIYVTDEDAPCIAEGVDDRLVRAVCCISSYTAKLIADEGVGKPVHAIGYGFDQWAVPAASLDWSTKLPAKSFCFLHISSCDAESGLDLVIEAFCSTFSRVDDVCLVVRPLGGEVEEIQSVITRASKAAGRKPDIVLLTEELNDNELQSLLSRCDVLVAPCRAGGFGLPIARGLLAGTPAIVTAWGGHLDYCDEASCWMIDYIFERPKADSSTDRLFWAQPSVPGLVSAMQAAFRSSPLKRATKALAGRALLLDKFNWDAVTYRLTAFAAGVLDQKPPLRFGWITTWNVKCGIAAYSAHLLEEIPSDQVTIFAARDKDILQVDDENCLRIWNSGKEKNDLDHIVQNLINNPLDAIMISFNYGFFSFVELSSFINDVSDMGIVVIIELHSTSDPFNDTFNFRLAELSSALRRCGRVLVHSVKDMNRMKAVGVIDNVTLFPHGSLDRSSSKASRDDASTPLLASFGFAYANKGLVELVEAIGLLRDKSIDLRLLMLNAEGPSDESRALISEIRKTIEKLNLADKVELVTDFMEKDDCLSRLAAADLIVNPYQHTGESASGAVTDSMATGRPVLVTPLEIFDDLGAAVFRADGITPNAIADAIAKTLIDLKQNSAAAVRVSEASQSWRETHNFGALSQRLMQIAATAVQTERFSK